MYQAPIVAAVIFFAYFWRSLTFRLEAKGWRLPFVMHYYTILYILVAVLTAKAIHSLYSAVLVPTDWLEADTVRDFVKDVMNNSDQDQPHLEEVFSTWEEEADLANLQWLKYFALSCPIWCVATLIACALHTLEHVKAVRGNEGRIGHRSGEKYTALWHDCIIMILALPMIYGLMSFKSVVRCLQIYINHIPAANSVVGGGTDASQVRFHSYEERKSFLMEMYGANFAVGDIMETIALVTFGELIADYLRKRMERTKAHMEQKDVAREDIHTLEAASKTVSALTVAGVTLFCTACLLSGGWNLVVTTMPSYFPSVAPGIFSTLIDENTGEAVGTLQREETKASAEQFFLGFSFAASFAAIGNIMTLEGSYHEFLEEFMPSMKFWGTKILVSLACVQGIALSSLSILGWTEVQINLLYACMLSLECLLIAIFHFKAWGATEPWFKDQQEDPKMQPLLDS